MSFNVTWDRSNDVLVATLDGRIDGSNADAFHNSLAAGTEAAESAVVLDFEKVSFISSAGLRVILLFARQFNQPGKKLAICTLSGPVREVVSVSGFDQLISVYESLPEATRAVEGD